MNRRHVLSITTLSVVTFFALVPGCTTLSVEGSDDGGGSSTGGEDATVTPTPDTGSKVDATSEVKDSSVSAVDAKADVVATKDASADVTVDVGKPPPAAGSACTTIGEIFKKGCGLCGTQEAVCESTKVVSAYGFCQGEVANGCAPGSTRQGACGLCGTRSEICQNNCAWAGGVCQGEPANACAPGSTKTTTAGCAVQGEVKVLTCDNVCQFSIVGSCGPIPSQTLAINGAVAQEASNTFSLSPVSDKIKLYDTIGAAEPCPATLDVTETSYAWIKLTNPTNKVAKVSVWATSAAGGNNIDTVMGWYNSANPPPTDADRMACTGYINDTCDEAPCDVNADWGGLINFAGGPDARPSIPANGAIVIYHAAYNSNTTGQFILHVRTDSLQ